MNTLNTTTRQASPALVQGLHGLLADAVLWQWLSRQWHWNVTGPRFRELHAVFDELVTQADSDIDALAERSLTLGAPPPRRLADLVSSAALADDKADTHPGAMLAAAQDALHTRLARSREVIDLAEAAGDRGTVNLLDAMNDRLEKTAWLLRASADA
jgi:starvation-inducible DNA-binding protein